MMRSAPVAATMLLTYGLLAVVACGLQLGDRSHGVELVNKTPITLFVWNSGLADASPRVRLEPEATHPNQWLWPLDASDTRTRVVRAYRADGTVAFCRAYDFRQLERLGWKIEIGTGVVEC